MDTYFLGLVFAGEDASMMVQAFCENSDFTVGLPGLGSWVGVRVTAALNPGHFWVQFPCGSGPIEKRIMEGIAYYRVGGGREDSVNTTTQYSFGLGVSWIWDSCGKPNKHWPKHYPKSRFRLVRP